MFTEIKSIIKNHVSQHDSLKATFIENKKAIFQQSEYTMSFNDKRFAELKKKYDSDRFALINDSKEQAESAFEKIYTILEDAVTAELGQETISDLQMLMNTKVSKFEIDAYAKKFAGNFKALRLINKIAENSGVVFSYISDSDVISDLNKTKAMTIAFFGSYDGRFTDEYMTRYILACAEDVNLENENNSFSIMEKEINSFLKPIA